MSAEPIKRAGQRPPEDVGAVLVCGAGIAGMQAALDLAGSGFKVYLVDSSPAIGGRMAQLDKTFPTGDCAMCIISPKLVECARNKNIEIITLARSKASAASPADSRSASAASRASSTRRNATPAATASRRAP